ncbi:MAG: beta-galactosidase GalB [Verrucomicrobiota bacterium]
MTARMAPTCAAATLLLLSGAAALAADAPRERLSFDADWLFTKDDPSDATDQLHYDKVKDQVKLTGQDLQAAPQDQMPLPDPVKGDAGGNVSYAQPSFDESGWRHLSLPHDWGIEGPFKQEYFGGTGKLPYWGVGWYRKHFDLPGSDQGRRIFLSLDGAMSYSMVWINGHFVGGWPYGYTSYQVELTPYVTFGGTNVIAVRLDNPNSSSRWYPGGGIYRHVWLVKTAPVHVANNGTYLTTPEVSGDAASIDLKVSIDNEDTSSADVTMQTNVYELDANDQPAGMPVAHAADRVTIPSATRQTAEAKLSVTQPKLWDLAHPNRYVAVTMLAEDNRLVDRYETPFGIRTIKFDPNTGFSLNGEHIEINGTCNHADLGALGTAINDRALQRQLEILKDMGCNALRTSHNPPAPELLALCDKMGFVVMDEAFDCWGSGKNPNDYHTVFWDWHVKDLRAMVRRDRNHPSVVLWSIGNEVSEQGWGQKTAQELADIVRSEDPTRPVTAACNYVEAGFNGFQKALDVFGYNYKYGNYESFHDKNPDEPIFGSETASTISSRGEYFFPPDSDKTNFQVSSYDETAPGWASPPDPELKAEARLPYVFGEFVWTGFDYLGEPTPYNDDATNLMNFTDPAQKAKMAEEMKTLGKLPIPSRSSYFGAVDLAGFRKDLFYLFQAAWRPDYPMAHILPHWNWPERAGQVTPVVVYTSGDEAELFLNGESLGRKQRGSDFRLQWNDVKYQPGELKVVAYKNGQPWAQDDVKTTGPAAKLLLTPDRAALKADGQDLAFVTLAIADADGLTVPRSNNLVTFSVSGPGELVATDNGDATSLVSFQSPQRAAFNGLALAIVRTQAGKSGDIVVKASADGLAPAEVTLKSN